MTLGCNRKKFIKIYYQQYLTVMRQGNYIFMHISLLASSGVPWKFTILVFTEVFMYFNFGKIKELNCHLFLFPYIVLLIHWFWHELIKKTAFSKNIICNKTRARGLNFKTPYICDWIAMLSGNKYQHYNVIYYIDTSVLLENIPLVKFIKTTSGTRVVYFP